MIAGVLTACKPKDYEGMYNDDAKIASSDDICSKKSSTTNYIAGVHKQKTKVFNGVESIRTVTVPENPSIKLDLKINGGKFKIVLVSENKTVYLLTSESTDGEKILHTELPAGKYKLKLVGVKANFELSIVCTVFQWNE
ncbi:MAG: hypothetical protein LBT20_00085 [Clostridiales bacterium]|jgi:hypothetical protein|nr:hypothetical protein [Clostridiales bacterium]